MYVDVLLVSGDRHAKPRQWRSTCETLIARYRPLVLIHGAAEGIDTIMKEAAEATNLIGIEPYEAEWDKWEKLGKRNFAGPARNQEMLDRLVEYRDWGREVAAVTIHPDIEASRGTKHMRSILQRSGVRYIHIAAPIG